MVLILFPFGLRSLLGGFLFGFGLSRFGHASHLRLILHAKVATNMPKIRMGEVDITGIFLGTPTNDIS